MLSAKTIKAYSAIFDKTAECIQKEVQNSGAKCTSNSITFKYNEIVSHGITQNRKKYSILNKNVYIFVRFDNDYDYIDYAYFETNAIYPHVSRSPDDKIRNMCVRHMCLGDNFEDCIYLLQKFQLTNLRFALEDIMSEISEDNGYWRPVYYGCKPEANLEFRNCKLCKRIAVKSNFSLCEICKEQIKENPSLSKSDPKLLKHCNKHGFVYSEEIPCQRCRR